MNMVSADKMDKKVLVAFEKFGSSPSSTVMRLGTAGPMQV